MHNTLLEFISIARETTAVRSGFVFRRFENGKPKGRKGRAKKSVEEIKIEGVPADIPIVGHGDLLTGRRFIDTQYLSRILIPTLSSYTLDHLCSWFGILEKGDAPRKTGMLFIALMDCASSFDKGTLKQLASLLSSSGESATAALLDRIEPQIEDEWQPSACRGSRSISSELRSPRKKDIEVQESDIMAVLGRSGSLAAIMNTFEERHEQLDMARAVMDAVNEGRVLLAEAGTGTGKSYAYLVPVIFWAVLGEKRVVVSTNTKNLQDQLCKKDLPALKRAFPFPFRYSLLKGRENYLCKARLDAAVDHGSLIPDERTTPGLLYLISWSSKTETGDIAENKVFDCSGNVSLWKKVSCDARFCPNREGPRDCFLSRARDNALRSHVVVVNHALLLNDISMGKSILGDYETLVIDEAHNLEKVAFEQFGKSISYFDFFHFFEGHFGRGNEKTGLQRYLGGLLAGAAVEEQRSLSDLVKRVATCRVSISRFFDSLGDIVDREQASHSVKKRYRPQDETTRILGERAAVALEELGRVRSHLSRMLALSADTEGSETERNRADRRELSGVVEELTELIGTLDFLTNPPTGDWVYWIQGDETNFRNRLISLRGCPIETAPLFKELIYETTRAVVMSSATLSTGGDFSFSSKVLGTDLLDPDRVTTFQGGTSFPLESQVLLALPTFLPGVSEGDFVERLPDFLRRVVEVVPGGTLVLFTSREWLRKTRMVLKPLLEEEGITCVAQDEDGSRETLIEKFRLEERSVLLGTDSFWEGIDVPGESLQLVVIVRLPFLVPSEPIMEAIAERMSAAGLNAFTEYSLPRAAIRLKQGFGRLIRHRSDTGAVLILDKRIVEKNYGVYLQRAMPVAPMVTRNLEDLISILVRWCESAGTNAGVRIAPIETVE